MNRAPFISCLLLLSFYNDGPSNVMICVKRGSPMIEFCKEQDCVIDFFLLVHVEAISICISTKCLLFQYTSSDYLFKLAL